MMNEVRIQSFDMIRGPRLDVFTNVHDEWNELEGSHNFRCLLA